MRMTVQGRWWWGDAFVWASRNGVWTADRLAFEARHFDAERGLDRIVRILAEDRLFTDQADRVWIGLIDPPLTPPSRPGGVIRG